MKKKGCLYAAACAVLLMAAFCTSVFSSFKANPIEEMTILTPYREPPKFNPDNYKPGDSISVPSKVRAQANEKGKGLLKQYDVQYHQTVRFPIEEYVFETHGADVISSLADARSKYPQWPIPEKLGGYEFADFMLYQERTSLVIPTARPYPKDKPVVLDDREPSQYYLCYKNGSAQFRLCVIPMTPDEFKCDILPYNTFEFIPCPSHPGAYYSLEKEDSASLYHSLLIAPEPDRNYAFFIFSITGADCLESEDIPFSEQEAAFLYEAIQQDFPKDPPRNQMQ